MKSFFPCLFLTQDKFFFSLATFHLSKDEKEKVDSFCSFLLYLNKSSFKGSDQRVLQAQKVYWLAEVQKLSSKKNPIHQIIQPLRGHKFKIDFIQKSLSQIVEFTLSFQPFSRAFLFEKSSSYERYCYTVSCLPLETLYYLLKPKNQTLLKNEKEVFYHLGLFIKKIMIFKTLGYQMINEHYFLPENIFTQVKGLSHNHDKKIIIEFLEQQILSHRQKFFKLIDNQVLPFYFRSIFKYYAYLFEQLKKNPMIVFEQNLQLGFLGKVEAFFY